MTLVLKSAPCCSSANSHWRGAARGRAEAGLHLAADVAQADASGWALVAPSWFDSVRSAYADTTTLNSASKETRGTATVLALARAFDFLCPFVGRVRRFDRNR